MDLLLQESPQEIMALSQETIWISVFLVGVVVLVAVLLRLRHGPLLPPRLTLEELLAMRRLEVKTPGEGVSALKQYYEWRRDQWRQLARGSGASAFALLATLIAALLDPTAAGIVNESSSEAAATLAMIADTPLLFLTTFVVILFLAAAFAWSRAHVVHDEFASNLPRLSQ